MTKSYERIINDGHSREYLEFQRLASVRDYKDTRTAPPPLNLIANFRGSIWLSVYFFLAIASGSVASYFIYTWGYPLLAPNWGSNAAFTVLHGATWLIALLGSMFVTLCIRLQNWLEGALCGNRNRPDKGFSVRATPAESHLTATKEHNYLKKALRKRKELDAQTTHRQIGDVRDGQQVLQNEQRLGLEQLNGRIDRIRRRFNDFEKHYKKNIHLILEKLDSDSPTAARNSSSGSLNNSNGSFNNTNDDAQSRSSSDAAPSRPDRLDMSFFSTSTSACSEAPASASPTKPPRVGVSAKKAQFADQVRLPVPQRSSSKIGSSSSSSSQAPAHEAPPECNAMDISGVDGLDVLANVADGATRQPTVELETHRKRACAQKRAARWWPDGGCSNLAVCWHSLRARGCGVRTFGTIAGADSCRRSRGCSHSHRSDCHGAECRQRRRVAVPSSAGRCRLGGAHLMLR